MEELKQKLSQKEKAVQDLHAQAHKFMQKYEDAISKNNSYQLTIEKIIAEMVYELEKSKESLKMQEMMAKKAQLGIARFGGHNLPGEDWIDGPLITKLKDERAKIVDHLNVLEDNRKRLNKKGPRPSRPDEQNIDKEHIKITTTTLSRRIEEIDHELEKVKHERFEIMLYDRWLYSTNTCLFARKHEQSGTPAWPLLLNQFKVVSMIGKGGFAEVFKAYDLKKFEYVALKVHRPDLKIDTQLRQSIMRHITRENEVYSRLDHPNIVQFFGYFNLEHTQAFCTILEYCEGPDLDHQLKKKGSFPEKQAKHIIKQIIAAIKYLNEQNPKIIHYDLKPQNILFTNEGIVKVTDFGLCKIHDSDESKIDLTSVGAGTYWYLPPECFENGFSKTLKISSKVDVWSIGVMLYQMLYGKKPFGNNMSQEAIHRENIILRSKTVVFEERPAVSIDTKEFIRACLTHDQNQRIDINTAWNMIVKITN
jgi:tousled-like kinase